MSPVSLFTRLLCNGLLLLASAGTLANAPYEVDTDSRVVAFGDVHGAYDEFTGLLQEVGVIDKDTNWAGGDTHLVSLGDLIDRGPGSRQVVELMMKLQQQARAAGGNVHVVLGNHEVMVMSGDLRYVSRPEYAAFAGEENEAQREALLAEFRETRPDISDEEVLLEFEKLYPPGFIGFQRAYAPDGRLGKWLLQQPIALRVNNSLYMHGGISNAIAEMSLSEINGDNMDRFREYLRLVESLREQGVLGKHVGFWDRRLYLNSKAEAVLAADPEARPDWFQDFAAMAELEGQFLFSDQSPIWYRGSVYCHPYSESFNVERLLKRAGASQLVIGHTPDPRGSFSRMEGLVVRLDTGMLKSVYQGIPTALVQENGSQYIHYAGQPEQAQPTPMPRSISQELWGMSDAEIEELLRNGRIVAQEDIGTGITKPKKLTLQLGDRTEYAAYKNMDEEPGLQNRSTFSRRRHNDSDRYVYDPAAYRIDRLIDLQMVPVSVLREVDGEEGTVGVWIPDGINERDRLEQEVAFGGYCAKDEQYRMRFIFDVLIYNTDRNLTNIIWTKKDWQLRFIDHSLAFKIDEKRPKQYRKIELRMSDLMERKLKALNQAQLEAEVSEWLHPRQIEAIMARRDLILKQALRTDP